MGSWLDCSCNYCSYKYYTASTPHARDQPALALELLAEVAARFADDSFLPLPYREFAPAQMVEAFRHMQGARHIGKLVISYPQGVPAAPGRARPLRLRHNAR